MQVYIFCFRTFAAVVGLLVNFAAYILIPQRITELHLMLRMIKIELPQKSIRILTIHTLLAGEDHRFFFHQGLDPIAVLRAVIKTAKGRLQGASSIEQQLVRTVIGDYRICIRRKLVEMMLASTVNRVFTKEEVIFAYLSVAYFGTKMLGFKNASKKLEKTSLAGRCVITALISHLKYPMSSRPNEDRSSFHNFRSNHIVRRRSVINPWIPARYKTTVVDSI